MSGPRPAALALMGLLFARTMAWASSGKTHPELVNNLYSEYGRPGEHAERHTAVPVLLLRPARWS